VVRGHRRREYCDDLCRQAEFRARRDDQERARIEAERRAAELAELEELRQRYGDLRPDTLQFLLRMKHGGGQLQADTIAALIAVEVERVQPGNQATKLRELVDRVTKRLQDRTTALEQAQAELEQERADLRTIRREQARTDEEFHQLRELAMHRGDQLSAARNQIKRLEAELEQTRLQGKAS
jgi:DNA repair exonuclease SbcCD ATPase subunit